MAHAKFVPKEKGYICIVKKCPDKQETIFESAGEITAHLLKAHRIHPDDQDILGIKDVDEFNKHASKYLKKKGIKVSKYASPREETLQQVKDNPKGIISVTLMARMESGKILPIVIGSQYILSYVKVGMSLKRFLRTAIEGYFFA